MVILKTVLFLTIGLPYIITELQFRLRGGGRTDGLVEVKDKLLWRPICVGVADLGTWSGLFCHKLGLNSSHALNLDARMYPAPSERGVDLKVCNETNCWLDTSNVGKQCHPNVPTFEYAAVFCSDEAPGYRLHGGESPHSGRFEVYYNNTWGPVCVYVWTTKESTVACKALGLPSSDARYILGRYIGGPEPPHLSQVNCLGNETSFQQCNVWWSDATCYKFVSVSCGEAREDQIRLTGGHEELSGLLEVYHNGSWRTFCNGFDKISANVACNEIAVYPVTYSTWSGSRYVYGRPQPLIERVSCRGYESRLMNCHHSPFSNNLTCSFREQASITCGHKDERLRLSQDGLLEVLHNGEWGTICGDFQVAEATVACKTLRLPSTFAKRMPTYSSEGRSGRIWTDGVKCSGGSHEKSLFDCYWRNMWGNVQCNHREDVSIMCADIHDVVNFRLDGGPVNNLGYLKIAVLDEWGYISYVGFGEQEAKVACTSLGLRTEGAKVVANTEFLIPSNPSGTVWLDEVKCRGTESSIIDCQHGQLGENDRTGKEVVAVYCGAPTVDDYLVRFAGDAKHNTGRVEVKIYGQWGTVCEQGFDINAAKVVCRQLNLPSSGAAVLPTGQYPGSGLIWLNEVHCYGWELSLKSCSPNLNSIQSSHLDCTHLRDVAIECKDRTYYHVSSPETIVGSVIAGVCLIMLVISTVLFILSRKRQRNKTTATIPQSVLLNGMWSEKPEYQPSVYYVPPAYDAHFSEQTLNGS